MIWNFLSRCAILHNSNPIFMRLLPPFPQLTSNVLPAPVVTESSGLSEIDDQLGGITPREEMTAEEKQKASRDRNREHARNTRLRKKAYLAQLQNTVANLQEEAASSAAQNAQNEEKIHKQR